MYQRHVKKKLKPFPLKLPAKTPKNQVLRQDPGYRDPEDGMYVKRAYF